MENKNLSSQKKFIKLHTRMVGIGVYLMLMFGLVALPLLAQEQQVSPPPADSTSTTMKQGQDLHEVVVTALGIKKELRSLSFASQSVDSKKLTEVKTTNLVSALDGKVAGLNISGGGSGVGSSPTIILRGARSLLGKNQPIIVIDGVRADNFTPFTAGASSPGGLGLNVVGGGATNGTTGNAGDGLSLINPDDIETINVIKGATGAALYGGEAANGVIIITTKKAREGVRVDVSSTNTFSNVGYSPDLQFRYGPGNGISESALLNSWGIDTLGRMQGGSGYVPGRVRLSPNYLDDFFRMGFTTINSVSVAVGKDNSQFFGSYSNNNSSGIMPNNTLSRHNVNLREVATAFNGRLEVDAKVTYVKQNSQGSSPIGLYFNPMVSLYLFPRGIDFSIYKEYDGYSPVTNNRLQHWYGTTPAPGADSIEMASGIGYAGARGLGSASQNPFWTQYRTASQDNTDRLIGSVGINFKITDNLRFSVRGIYDRTDYTIEKKIYAGSSALLSRMTGRYFRSSTEANSYYTDAILNYTKTFNDKFSLSALVGGAFIAASSGGVFLDSEPVDLYLTNTFTRSAVPGGALDYDTYYERQLGGAFAAVNLAYKNMVYLDLTARNDWSSTLPTNANSFFYPSAGLSIILSDLFHIQSGTLNLLKLRGSFAQVGNDVPAFITNPRSTIDRTGNVVKNTAAPYAELKPEISNNWEVGLEADFFNHALGFGLSFYRTNTLNQLFGIPASPASGYSTFYINAGNVQNQGFELILEFTPVNTLKNGNRGFRWSGYVNASKNWNEIIELASGLDFVTLSDPGNEGFASYMTVGGSFGDLYTRKIARDSGRIMLDQDGKPTNNPAGTDNIGGFYKVGNSNNQWLVGFGNTFMFRNFSVNFLVDFRLGGEVVSLTQSELDFYGLSEATAAARDDSGIVRGRFVTPDGQNVSRIDARTYYETTSGRGNLESYVYDATSIRLRQVAISYTFPSTIIKPTSFIKGVTLSVIARNLFYFYRPAPFDPQIAGTFSGVLPGVDIYSVPTTQDIGFTVKVQL